MNKKLTAFMLLMVGFAVSNLSRTVYKEPEPVESTPEPVIIDRVSYWEEHPEESPYEDIQNARSVALVASAVTDSIYSIYGIEPNIDCQVSVMQCVLNRVDTAGFPETIQDVCKQPNQWQGLTDDTEVKPNLKEYASKLIEFQDDIHETIIPEDCVYFCLTPMGIEYRSTWEDSSDGIYFVPYRMS